MIDPSAVAFDVDGVVADTMGLFLRIARSEYRIEGVSYEDMTHYSLADCLKMDPALIDVILDRILEGRYSEPLMAIDGSGSVLARLVRYRSPLLFVTARPHPGPINDWMKVAVGVGDAQVRVVATGTFEGKTRVLQDNGIRFFVEDRLETCYQVSAAGIEPVVYRQPWNRENHPFTEVRDWRELETLIDF